MVRFACFTVALLATLSCFTASIEAITLEAVKQRGELHCGVPIGAPGFSNPDEKGVWSGLNVDICRAVAAAVVGDGSKVKYIPLSAKNQITALLSGEVDLLSMNISWTMTLDTSVGLHFAGVTYFDGQGFLVRKKLNLTSVLELSGAAMCLQNGPLDEPALARYFQEHNMDYKVSGAQSPEETVKSLESGRCNVMTGKRSELYGLLRKLQGGDDFAVLPEVISREPMGPVVRQGDDAWFNVVRWSLFAMINAEQYGVSSTTVDEMKLSKDPDIRKLLGFDGITGKGLGLNNDWAYQIIKQVGNYAEVFDRNVGMNSPLKMERGLNALWNRGGIQYAPPVR